MTIARFLLTWATLAVAMTANGIFRELALKRLLPAEIALFASAAIGVAIILLVTRTGFRPLAGSDTRTLVVASVAMLVMTVAFECAIGRWVDGKSWAQLGANYAFWRGNPWTLVLLLVMLTPFVWGRWAPTRGPDVAGRTAHA